MSTINPIILIEAIVKEGNISAAAETLYVSQPYLSKLLKQIESDIGITIFDRQPRAMNITYAGERYLAYLKRIESVEQDMLVELDMIAKHKLGKIKVGINPALGSSILPRIIPPFLKKHPEVSVELVEEDADTIEYLLENHLIDVAIGMMPIRNEKFEYEYLYDDNMHILVSNQSPLYDPNLTEITKFPYEISTLDNLPLVMLNKGKGIRRLIDDFYDKYGLKENIQLETNTIYSAIGIVRKGLGHTFIPVTGMAWPTFNNCNLFVFDSDILISNFVLFYLKDRSFSPIHQTFIDMATVTLRRDSTRFRIKSK